MKIYVGIPARMGSTRFYGKPLSKVLGISILEHCFLRSSLNNNVSDVFIACCDKEIEVAAKKFKAKTIFTDPNISRPSLRVAQAAEKLNLDDEDILVVVQGDEPLVNPKMIDLAVEPLQKEKDIYVSNLCSKIGKKEMLDPNEIKVVCDLNMNALYFSRSPIPSTFMEEKKNTWFKQVCIMPFKWHFMKKFMYKLSPTSLELQESIEMIRALQYGFKVKMVFSPYITKSVDTEHDRVEVEKLMIKDELFKQYNYL